MDSGFPSGIDLLFGSVDDIEATQTQAVKRPDPYQVPYGSTQPASPKRRSKQKRRLRNAAPSQAQGQQPIEAMGSSPQEPPAWTPEGLAEVESVASSGDIGKRWNDFVEKLGVDPFSGKSEPLFKYMQGKVRGKPVPFPKGFAPEVQQSIDAYAEVNADYHRALTEYQRRRRSARINAKARPQPGADQAPDTAQPDSSSGIPSGLDMLFSDEPKAANSEPLSVPTTAAPAPAAEATQKSTASDERSWLDPVGYYNYFSGANRDPRFKDVEGFNPGDMPDFKSARAVASATAAGADDERYADVIEKQLGKRFRKRFKDANGATIIEFIGKKGVKERRYINAPGLDYQDVDRGLSAAVPYMIGGGLAGSVTRTAGIGTQMLAQALTAGGVSAGGDVASKNLGAKQGVDPWKAAMAATFAGVGQGAAQGVGFLYRRLVAEPRLYNRATGQLTEAGAKAAQEAGMDPGQVSQSIARSFAKEMAKTNNAKQAAMSVRNRNEFGIPSTRGQRTKNPSQLTDEAVMRKGGYGKKAEEDILAFDQRQLDALNDAAVGGDGARRSIAREIDPTFDPSDMGPGTYGQRVGEGLRAAENRARELEREAWGQVSELIPTDTALGALPETINRSLGGRVINPRVTPTAHEMRNSVMSFINNSGLPDEGAQVIGGQSVRSVDQMRRMLGEWLKGTRNDTDDAAANAIYDGFNNWIRESAEAGVLSGQNDMAANLFSAIDISRAINQVFRPRGNVAENAAGRFIKNVIDDAVTPEGLVSDMVGASFKNPPKKGAAEALTSIRNGLMNFLEPDQAIQTWNAIRVAHWTRIVKAKNGEMVGARAMQSNLKGAFEQQGSIMRQLYTPNEIATMRSFLKALDDVVYVSPNASGSGITATAEARKSVMNFLGGFSNGPMGRFVSSIFNNTVGPVLRNIEGGAALTKAIRQGPSRPVNPVLGNYSAAITGESFRQHPTEQKNKGLLQ
jgi:hypothetical protein